MYHHFMAFADEAHAILALHRYGKQLGGVWVWDASCIVADQRVIIERAKYDYSDPDNQVQIAPEQRAEGYFVTVSCADLDNNLLDMHDGRCMFVARNAGEITYIADGAHLELGGAIIDPAPSGCMHFMLTS